MRQGGKYTVQCVSEYEVIMCACVCEVICV